MKLLATWRATLTESVRASKRWRIRWSQSCRSETRPSEVSLIWLSLRWMRRSKRYRLELDKKTSELSQFLNRFSEKRRALNQRALTEWFKRSLFVGLLTAGIVVVVCGVSVAARNSSTANLSAGKKAPVTTSLGFVATAPRQVGLIKPVESPVLADAAFHFSFQPKTGPIPDSISSALAELPKTNTALKLASILGGYPEIPASRSHHLNESGGLIVHTANALKTFGIPAFYATRSQDRASGHTRP